MHPDLAFVTGLLCRFPSNLGQEHWKLVNNVLCYLQGTNGLMLTYRRSESLHIVGYSDSYYAGDGRKSTSRYVFTLARGAISWKSSKQTVFMGNINPFSYLHSILSHNCCLVGLTTKYIKHGVGAMCAQRMKYHAAP
jgi:hypothetical protein